MHSFSKLLTFAALVFTTFATKDDCLYDVWGSESDTQTNGYEFCKASPLSRLTKDYARITANLVGKANYCNPLEPDKSEEELKANLGIDLRPFFKAIISLNADGTTWDMAVGQYGDPACSFAQRRTTIKWGVGQCKQGIVSEGYVSEMYFVNDDCADLESATQTELSNVAAQSFQVTPTGSGLPNLLIDPYPVLAAATANPLYYVNNKVLSKAYTAPFGRHTGYCYGIGQKFQAPYHLATMFSNSGELTYYNEIFLPSPVNGLLCGYSCAADIQSAIDSATADSNLAKAPVYFALTQCGIGYKLNLAYTDANKNTAPFYGLSQGAYFFSSLMLHYSNPKVCNKCVSGASLGTDALVALLSMSGAKVPKSRFILCQPEVKSVSYVYQEKATGPADPNDCTPVVLPTVSASRSSSQTPTATKSISQSPTISVSVSDSPTASVSISQSPTISVSVSDSPTASVSISQSPTISVSVSDSPTASVSISQSPTISLTPTNTPTGTLSPSITASETATISVTPTTSVEVTSNANTFSVFSALFAIVGFIAAF